MSFWLDDTNRRTITRDDRKDPHYTPVISTGLDSVRTYGFVVDFNLPTGIRNGGLGAGVNPTTYDSGTIKRAFSLAAKQVSNTGYTNEDIEVHRFNDRVYYPGKPSLEEVTVTFDNLLRDDAGAALFDWFRTIYDPMRGTMNRANRGSSVSPNLAASVGYKQLVTITNLASDGTEVAKTNLIAAYPKSWKTAEFNYSNNDFHTIEVSFRYDYIDHVSLDKIL